MEGDSGGRSPLEQIIATTKAVITDPRGFYRGMPRSGGFVDPLVFVAALSVVSAIVAVPFWMIGAGPYGAFPGFVFAFVIAPLLTVAFSFVWAAVLFCVWRLLGSRESYETAYRCTAYATALSPVAVLMGVLPYLGSIAMVVWGFFLIVIASEEVHGIEGQKARLVFGVIAVVFALMSVGSQRAARHVEERTDELTEQVEKMEEMSPEEAGKAVGEFMKGLQGAIDEKPEDEAPPE